jgi:nitrite reductase (NADH) large subunit
MDGSRGMGKERLVIAGAGMAAHRLVEELVERAPGRYAITLLGAEPHAPYNRILLSQVLSGEKRREETALSDAACLAARGARLRTATPVHAIDRDLRIVVTAAGEVIGYDKLVLAIGSQPIRPAIPGADFPGVVAFRDLDDVESMLAAAGSGARAVVIGGGLLGLEAAAGLAKRSMAVTVVHLMPTLMERQLDADAAGLLAGSLAERGIAVAAAAEAEAILGGETVTGVRLKNGTVLPADLVVVAIGIRPNVEIARRAGLACGRGVLVDDGLAASDPAIFALGECIEHRKQTFGLVAPIWEQARVLAERLAGGDARYEGSTSYASLKVTGIDLFSAGVFEAHPGDEPVLLRDRAAGIYRKLVLREGRLAGALLYGDAEDADWYLELIRSRAPVDHIRRALMFGRSFAESLAA